MLRVDPGAAGPSAGRDPVGVDRLRLDQRHPQRHDDPRRRTRQAARPRVRGEQDALGSQRPVRRPQFDPAGPGLDRLDGRLLMDADAALHHRTAQPAREHAGVEHAARALEDAAEEPLRQPEAPALDELDLAARGREPARDPLRAPQLPRRERGGDVADRLVLAVDLELLDQALGEVHGRVGEADQRRRAPPVHRREQLRIAGDRGREVAGVPRARSPAAEARLEHHDVDAALREPQRRREPGVAAADDRDVAGRVTRERGCALLGRIDPAAEVGDLDRHAVRLRAPGQCRAPGRIRGGVTQPGACPAAS